MLTRFSSHQRVASTLARTCLSSRLSSTVSVSATRFSTAAANVVEKTDDAPFVSKHSSLASTMPEQPLPPLPIFPVTRVNNSAPVESVSEMVRWIIMHGGSVSPNLYIGSITQLFKPGASDDGNWGGVALEDIPKGEVIVSVPLPLCLFPLEHPPEGVDDHNDTFYQGVAGVVASVPPSYWQLRLAVRLLAERAADSSFFSPYINCLPSSFPSAPVFFSPQAARSLQYVPMQTDLDRRAKAIHQLTKGLVTPVGASPQSIPALARCGLSAFNGFEVSGADFAWAASAVSSRAFQSPVPVSAGATSSNGDKFGADQKCLIPLVDMLNHSFDANTKTVFTRDVTDREAADKLGRTAYFAIVRTVRDIKRGEEITINYFKPAADAARRTVEQAGLTVTSANEDALSETVLTTSDMKTLFKTSLCRAPLAATHTTGTLADVTNDDVLLNFGFVPPFNVSDSVLMSSAGGLFETAMEMAQDVTHSHEYLQPAQPVLNEDGTVNPNATAGMNDHKLPLVLPQVEHRSLQQVDLLEFAVTAAPMTLSWLGPNDALTATLRILAAGSHRPRSRSERAQCKTGSIDDEMIALGKSEDTVKVDVEAAASETIAMAEERARAILATRGVFVGDDEILSLHQLYEGFKGAPLSAENEEGAMCILYHSLIMAAASFPNKLSEDPNQLMNSIIRRDSGEYTALMYGRSKKLMVSHVLKSLATRLQLDNTNHKWQYFLDK